MSFSDSVYFFVLTHSNRYIFLDINIYTQILGVRIFLSTCFGLSYPSSGNIHLESYTCYRQMSYAPPLLIKLIVKIEIKISEIKFESLHID
jgi:hypothetical protein